MSGAGVDMACDLPGVTCSTSGGSYWPPIIAGVVFVWWLGYRFGRFGGGRRR